MAYSYFDSAIMNLYRIGVLDILLPFILIFTLIFAILQRTKVLGKDEEGRPVKNFNVVIAIVIAFATIIPHILWGSGSPQNPYLSNGMLDVVQVINNALPSVSLIVVAILMFLIIIGVWGKNVDIGGTNLGGIIVILSIAAIIVIFALAAGWIGRVPNWLGFLRNPEIQALVVVILVFGLIIRFIVGPNDNQKKEKDKSGLQKLADAMKPADEK